MVYLQRTAWTWYLSGMNEDARAELAHRFQYHPPTNPGAREAHQKTRATLGEVAAELTELLPPGREAALFTTKIEEAMFWANAAIARHFGSEGGTTKANYRPMDDGRQP